MRDRRIRRPPRQLWFTRSPSFTRRLWCTRRPSCTHSLSLRPHPRRGNPTRRKSTTTPSRNRRNVENDFKGGSGRPYYFRGGLSPRDCIVRELRPRAVLCLRLHQQRPGLRPRIEYEGVAKIAFGIGKDQNEARAFAVA